MVFAIRLISWMSLIALIAPSFFFLAGRMELDRVKFVMLVSTVVWFVTALMLIWTKEQ